MRTEIDQHFGKALNMVTWNRASGKEKRAERATLAES